MAESEAVKLTQQDVINNVKLRQNQINAEKASKNPDQTKIDQLTQELVQYSLSADLVFQSQDLRLEMMKVAPDLQKGLAEYFKKLGEKSGDYWMTLQNAAREKQQTSLQDELDRMYQARLSAADGPAKLMATFKGFALLLQAFGVDTTNFVAECDRMIEAEYAKVPNKDIERLLKNPDFIVDPTQAAAMSKKWTQEGIKEAGKLQQSVNESVENATDGVGTLLNNSSAADSPTSTGGKIEIEIKKPQKSVSLDTMTTAMEQLLAESKLLTSSNSASVKKDIDRALIAAAGSDGNAKTVSSQDQKAIEINVAKVLEDHHLNAKDANLLTKRALERAQGMELAFNGH